MRRLLPIIVIVSMFGCYHEHRSPTDPSDGLLFSTSATSLPASGFARLTLTAMVDPRTTSANRTVTFKTSDGILIGAGTSGAAGKQLDVAVDVTGRAVAELQSSTNVGKATVSATAGSVTKTTIIDFTPAVAADIVRISVSNSSPPADGATVIQVYADVAPGLPADQRTVTFTTTYGNFLGAQTSATAKADNSNRATVDLKTPREAVTTRLTAAVAGVTAETTLKFIPALPDSISVSPAKLEIKVGEEVNVTATLRRVLGLVSVGQIVNYVALDAQNKSVGGFRNIIPSNGDGLSTAVFSTGTSTAPGLITIRASTVSSSGTEISADTTVRVLAP